MPNNILKAFFGSTLNSTPYEYPDAEELLIEGDPPSKKQEEVPDPPEPDDNPPEESVPEEEPQERERKPETQLDFARIQAEAILADARQEAEEYKEQARAALELELNDLRKQAKKEGYRQGFAEGMAGSAKEAKAQREQLAAEQIREIQHFLEEAAQLRDEILDQSREELKDLALAIAEKVIRVSLRSSSDILLRMIDSATEKHKRTEWAHIYIADCDIRGMACTVPELTAALGHISDRVRVIPMADDESGTCVIEMPDARIDASVSTQLGNIREILSSAGQDQDGGER